MKITAITIENFKGISDPVRVELKPITLLFGANSVGKSTIVQALHYVREILERNNVDADRCLGADESMDLGGFRNLVYNHDLERNIRFKIEISSSAGIDFPEYIAVLSEGPSFRVEKINYWSSLDVKSVWIELEIGWSYTLEKPIVYNYSTGFDNFPFAKISLGKQEKSIGMAIIDLDHPVLGEKFGMTTVNLEHPGLGETFNDLFRELTTPYEEHEHSKFNHLVAYEDKRNKSVLPKWGFPIKLEYQHYASVYENAEKLDGEVNHSSEHRRSVDDQVCELEGSFLSPLIVGPGELLLKLLNTSRYIGPIRKVPPRGYIPPRYSDETRWASGLGAWDLLQKSKPELISKTSDWMSRKDRLDSGYSLRMLLYKKIDMSSDLYETLLAKGAKGKGGVGAQIAELPEVQQLLLTDERRGLDVLPQDVGIGISQILPVVVGSLDEGTNILMVEQPELHIHPGLQCNLGDLFISAIQKEGKTFIIETHSEHLLLRLLRRIRENSDNELPEGVAGLTPEQVSVNYVEFTEDGLRIRPMEIAEDGDFNNKWPNGFFSERAKELF